MNDYQVTVSDGPIDLVTENAPGPLTCPVCSNPYWLVWGMSDFVKVSEKCKCKNQMPKASEKPKQEFEYNDDDLERLEPDDPEGLFTGPTTSIISEAASHFEGSDQNV